MAWSTVASERAREERALSMPSLVLTALSAMEAVSG